MKCLNCDNNTTNNKFCSRNCAATYNNKKFIKRKKRISKNKCKSCLNLISSKKTFCSDDCKRTYKKLHPSNGKIFFSDITKIEYVRNYTTYEAHSKLRGLAQTVYRKSGKPYICNNCGYDKHVEICHIKPISEFSDTALLSEINHIDNLVAHCPNCHWEFDNE